MITNAAAKTAMGHFMGVISLGPALEYSMSPLKMRRKSGPDYSPGFAGLDFNLARLVSASLLWGSAFSAC